MNSKVKPPGLSDLGFVLGIALFSLSCIATTYHTAKTLEPRQGSMSLGYMQARNSEDFSSDPVQLLGVSGRYGVTRGFDLGTEYTLDLTKENSNQFATIWADGKVQITNRDDTLFKPMISTGLIKGYIYDSDAKIHVTSLPILVSVRLSERFTPTVMYRYELLSDNFLPENFTNPRHTFALGLEYAFTQSNHLNWDPSINFCIGTINALDGDSEGNRMITLNLGIKLNSPYIVKADKY